MRPSRPFLIRISAYLAMISGCLALGMLIACFADRLTRRTPSERVATPQAQAPAADPESRLSEEERAERRDDERYGYGRLCRWRLRQLMEQGDACMLCEFRTEFRNDFKWKFDDRLSSEELPRPGRELVLNVVMHDLSGRLAKEGVVAAYTNEKTPADLSAIPPAYALYLRSLNADMERAIALMDEILALPAAEKESLEAIAHYRRARLRMSLEDWAQIGDDAAKDRIRRIRLDFAAVGACAKAGSLDPVWIGENADYWLAYVSSMLLPSDRLIRLGEADFGGAFRTYLKMPRRGEATGVNSSIQLAHKLCRDGGFETMVGDPDLRLLLTFYLCAGKVDNEEDPLPSELVGQRQGEWLDALDKAGIDPSFAPAHVAMLQYGRGRYDACQSTARLLPANDPFRRMLLSRCQLRKDGNRHAAARLLDPAWSDARMAKSAAGPSTPVTESFSYLTVIDLQTPKELEERILGELGMIALSDGDFAGALARFEEGGYGVEALYVAECLMTVEELKRHVDRRRGEHRPPRVMQGHWLEPFEKIEQELASRLMRAGRLEEALDYVAPPFRNQAGSYVLLLLTAERTDLDARVRADLYWRAAVTIRSLGEEIFHAPYGLSWSAGASWYVGYGFHPRIRFGRNTDTLPAPSQRIIGAGDEELRRLAGWQKEHIEHPDLRERDARYATFELALQAVRLLPDNDPAGAHILQYAGNLLKYRDPRAAMPALRQLTTRFGKTSYGEHAIRKNWFSAERPAPDFDVISK